MRSLCPAFNGPDRHTTSGKNSSMSRKGDCWDNAVAESFFGTLKSELDLRSSLSPLKVREMIFEYIEIFYNRKRLHSTLGYKTPVSVENQYWTVEEVS